MPQKCKKNIFFLIKLSEDRREKVSYRKYCVPNQKLVPTPIYLYLSIQNRDKRIPQYPPISTFILLVYISLSLCC